MTSDTEEKNNHIMSRHVMNKDSRDVNTISDILSDLDTLLDFIESSSNERGKEIDDEDVFKNERIVLPKDVFGIAIGGDEKGRRDNMRWGKDDGGSVECHETFPLKEDKSAFASMYKLNSTTKTPWNPYRLKVNSPVKYANANASSSILPTVTLPYPPSFLPSVEVVKEDEKGFTMLEGVRESESGKRGVKSMDPSSSSFRANHFKSSQCVTAAATTSKGNNSGTTLDELCASSALESSRREVGEGGFKSSTLPSISLILSNQSALSTTNITTRKRHEEGVQGGRMTPLGERVEQGRNLGERATTSSPETSFNCRKDDVPLPVTRREKSDQSPFPSFLRQVVATELRERLQERSKVNNLLELCEDLSIDGRKNMTNAHSVARPRNSDSDDDTDQTLVPFPSSSNLSNIDIPSVSPSLSSLFLHPTLSRRQRGCSPIPICQVRYVQATFTAYFDIESVMKGDQERYLGTITLSTFIVEETSTVVRAADLLSTVNLDDDSDDDDNTCSEVDALSDDGNLLDQFEDKGTENRIAFYEEILPTQSSLSEIKDILAGKAGKIKLKLERDQEFLMYDWRSNTLIVDDSFREQQRQRSGSQRRQCEGTRADLHEENNKDNITQFTALTVKEMTKLHQPVYEKIMMYRKKVPGTSTTSDTFIHDFDYNQETDDTWLFS